jgi:aminopeptidase N
MQRTLELALSQEIRSQDASALIIGLVHSPWGAEAAWSFMTTRWDALTAKLETFQGIPGLISSMSAFCSTDKANAIRAFFAQHPVPSSQRTIQQQIEKVESCATLKTRQGQALSGWIAAHAG